MKKKINKLIRIIISPFTIGLIVTAVFFYLLTHFYSQKSQEKNSPNIAYQALNLLHEKSIDWRLLDRGAQFGSDQVAIIAVDDRSVEKEGRWPWPREKIGRIISNSIDNGAKLIAFDAVFSEEDQNSSLGALSKLKNFVQQNSVTSPLLTDYLNKEMVTAASDQKLAEVIQKYADHIVMGSFFAQDVTPNRNPWQDACDDLLFKRSAFAKYWAKEELPVIALDSESEREKLPSAFKVRLNTYFDELESRQTFEWLTAHQAAHDAIYTTLINYGIGLTKDQVPMILPKLINEDDETLKQVFDHQQKLISQIPEIFLKINLILGQKNIADLKNQMRQSTGSYCLRFFGRDDELLVPTKFEQIVSEYKALAFKDAWQEVQTENKKLAEMKFEEWLDLYREHFLENSVAPTNSWTLNFPLLSKPIKHSGYFNADLDTDGTVRKTYLVSHWGSSYFPSIALKAFMLANKFGVQVKLSDEGINRADETKKIVSEFTVTNEEGDSVMKVPVNGAGELSINYSGKQKMFAYIPASEMLSSSDQITYDQMVYEPKHHQFESRDQIKVDRKAFLRDKILIFGATAVGIYDLRVTPFEENYPGVETHANVLSNLFVELEKSKNLKAGVKNTTEKPGFLRTHPNEESYMTFGILIFGIVFSYALATLSSIPGLILTSMSAAALYYVDKYFLFKNGIVINIVIPLSFVLSLFIVLTFYKYFTEERKKRELKGTFEKYVSPSIVAEILADPSNIELGGKKMELTVMFSDVRGFTTISEKLDPRALSDLLNSYLTPMTQLVFENKGTLDKYMGDAIMAFWGAPIHFKDHAQWACRCALQSIVKLKELQKDWMEKGLPEIDIGIGLNTGEMSVGNMGSLTVRSYTIMGDAVNLGSRLEGINKQYGTRIIVSEFTQAAAGPNFITREIDWVKVKGKKLPVRIFELMGEGSPKAELAEILKIWSDAFQLYHQRNFSNALECFKRVLSLSPDDEPSKLYVQRCEDYLSESPAPDWDGVFEMKSK
jgi:adenylate cyclase